MKFKKGDIVEVINEENFFGIKYSVGTHWVVARDIADEYNQVCVYDVQQNNRGYQAIFWDYNVKLIKRATPVDGDKDNVESDITATTLEESTTYTTTEINKIIFKAYQMFDNDSQRLAYLKGYFAK